MRMSKEENYKLIEDVLDYIKRLKITVTDDNIKIVTSNIYESLFTDAIYR